jgi:hypothetical protein
LIPQVSLRWNQDVNNCMIYGTGDIPVGAYQSTRLANLGIGHGVVDAGVGYSYFNPQTGHEFSAVLGFTANLENTSSNYTNDVDMHLDWGASQFLSKQNLVGLVGYVYQEVGCDSAVTALFRCEPRGAFGFAYCLEVVFGVIRRLHMNRHFSQRSGVRIW